MASLEKKFGRSAASRGETGLLSDGAVESTAIAIVLLHSRAATSSIIWCDENFQVLVSKSMSQLVGTAECPLWLDDQFEESGRFREAWKVRAEYEGLIKASCGDGPIWLKARLTRKLNQDGNLEQLIGVFIDVTFQIDQAFEHRLLRQTFAQMPLSIAIRDRRLPGSPVIFANQAAADIAHLALSDVIGKSAMTYQVKNQDSEIARNMRDCLAKGVIASGVLEARRRDGTIFVVDAQIFPIRDESGAVTHSANISQDVTRRVHDGERIRILSRAVDETSLPIYIRDVRHADRPIVYCNPAYAELAGLAQDRILGVAEPLPLAPDELHRRANILDLARTGEPFTVTVRVRRSDGHEFTVDHRTEVIRDSAGTVTHQVAYVVDVTQREREAAARRRQAVIAAHTRDAIAYIRHDGILEEVNEAYCKMVGRPREQLVGQKTSELRLRKNAEYADTKPELWETLAQLKQVRYEEQYVRPDGSLRTCEAIVTIDQKDDGKISGAVTLLHDVTDQRAQEEQLRQAQKLQSIGQLTGGVAHDFNNLLAVVLTNLELARDADATALGRAKRYIERAAKAANRGAELVQRLLAFSRRQALSPVAVSIDQLVAGMMDILRRSIRANIEITHVRKSTLWLCEVDKVQLESALLNLVINSRDAISGSGHIIIETDNVQVTDEYVKQIADLAPGPYVRLAVSDSGIGISPETLTRVFEPFFTTKSVGAGSGLGLSMVFGFAKQSGGHVTIYSEEGEGTTVAIYLPRSTGQAPSAEVTQADVDVMDRDSRVKVLFVEDDPDLQLSTTEMLVSMGYAVTATADAKSALDFIVGGARFDLLVTDVVLRGGVDGPSLARQARSLVPEMKVIYVSGYTENAFIYSGRNDEGVKLVHKPFTKSTLRKNIESVMGGRFAKTPQTGWPE